MLTDRLRQLLTAYVDGELSNRQRKAVLRLLRRSAEARALLRQLQDDAERLRRLPRKRLGDDFPPRVVQALPPRPQGRRPQVAEATVPLWAGLAAAAALLLAVGLGSFFYFSLSASTGDAVAVGPAKAPDGEEAPKPDVPMKGAGGEPQGGNAAPPSPTPPEHIAVLPAISEDKPDDAPPKDPGGTPPPVPVVAAPVIEMEMFKPAVPKVADPLPILNVHELAADKLSEILGKETALRIELPCRETTSGFRRLEAALKSVGATVLIEREAQLRLSRPRMKSNFVIFAEELTAAELSRALAHLGVEDRKALAARPRPDAQFSKVVLERLSDNDRKDLQALFRADTRPVSAAARPDTAKQANRPPERLALAVTYNPVRPAPGSPEVKKFFDGRKPLRPGAVQVLLVLRETPS